MPVRLEVRNLFWRSYAGMLLLRGVDFIADRGEIVVISGRSGSGRSTLLELCVGLKKPSGGQVLWDGADIGAMARKELLTARKRIGFLFQHHALISNYSVFDNIALPLRIEGSLTERQIERRVREVMEETALFGVERLFPESLSTCQLKAAALARALSVDPDMLFLDEPLSDLDRQTAEGIRAVLIEGQRRRPRTVITVSHDTDIWSPLECRILTLIDGKLISKSSL